MNNHNTLSIDEAKFLKTSKKLLSHINNSLLSEKNTKNNLFKLSDIQESLAQSLGFRNLNDFHNYLNQTTKKLNSFEKKLISPIFFNIESEQALQIFSSFMNYTDNNLLQTRALLLIKGVLQALIYMRDNNELFLNVDTISDYLKIDNVIKLYNNKNLPKDILLCLESYLIFLPDFQQSASKQSNLTLEQHGYLYMQIPPILQLLKAIEDNDFIIADQSWFIEVDIDSHHASSSYGASSRKIEQIKKHSSLIIHPALINIDFIEDSWIVMEEYSEWIKILYAKQQLNKVRVSDLLLYLTTIISPIKRARISLLLNSILDNYSIASKISQKIHNTINK